MDWACIENEARFFTKSCANMGTRREEEQGVVRGKPGEEQLKERDVEWGSEHG